MIFLGHRSKVKVIKSCTVATPEILCNATHGGYNCDWTVVRLACVGCWQFFWHRHRIRGLCRGSDAPSCPLPNNPIYALGPSGLTFPTRHSKISSDTVGCWFVDGHDLTGAVYDLQLQLSPPLPSSLASIKPVDPGSSGKMAVKTKREREREREREYARCDGDCSICSSCLLSL